MERKIKLPLISEVNTKQELTQIQILVILAPRIRIGRQGRYLPVPTYATMQNSDPEQENIGPSGIKTNMNFSSFNKVPSPHEESLDLGTTLQWTKKICRIRIYSNWKEKTEINTYLGHIVVCFDPVFQQSLKFFWQQKSINRGLKI